MSKFDLIKYYDSNGVKVDLMPEETDEVLKTFNDGNVVFNGKTLRLVRTDLKDDVCTLLKMTDERVGKLIGHNWGARIKNDHIGADFAVIDAFSDG